MRIKFNLVEGGSKEGNKTPAQLATWFVKRGKGKIWKGDKRIYFLTETDYGSYELEI